MHETNCYKLYPPTFVSRCSLGPRRYLILLCNPSLDRKKFFFLEYKETLVFQIEFFDLGLVLKLNFEGMILVHKKHHGCPKGILARRRNVTAAFHIDANTITLRQLLAFFL